MFWPDSTPQQSNVYLTNWFKSGADCTFVERLLETLTGLMCSEEIAHPWTHVRRDKDVSMGDN